MAPFLKHRLFHRFIASSMSVSVFCLSVRSAGQVKLDTLTWTDTLRHRQVPVAIYRNDLPTEGTPVILFSHGYNENRPGAYLHYSHLAEALASAGWSVVTCNTNCPPMSRCPWQDRPRWCAARAGSAA